MIVVDHELGKGLVVVVVVWARMKTRDRFNELSFSVIPHLLHLLVVVTDVVVVVSKGKVHQRYRTEETTEV